MKTLNERIHDHFDELSSTDRYIVSILIKDPDALNLSISEFAAKHHLSCSALTRLARRLEYDGYAQLRSSHQIVSQSPADTLATMNSVSRGFRTMFAELENHDHMSFYDAGQKANRYFVIGCGEQSDLIAAETARMLMASRRPVFKAISEEIIAQMPAFIESTDCVLFLCTGKSSSAFDQLLTFCLSAGAACGVICSLKDSMQFSRAEHVFCTWDMNTKDHVRLYSPYFVLAEQIVVRLLPR